MSNYTAAEVEAALQPLVGDDYDNDGWGELADKLKGKAAWHSTWSNTDYPAEPAITHVEVNGEQAPIEVVEDHGGGEGQGEERWVVVKVGTQFFKKEGYYLSHEGSEFDGDFKEVQKTERLVTFYE